MDGLTIVYVTARKQPMVHWFYESLKLQMPAGLPVQLVVVDYFAIEREVFTFNSTVEIKHVAPLPSFCQGEFKLTKENYFDASIARNTGFVYAKYDYVAFVDDVSVLMPTWLEAVLEGKRNKEIILGAYEKHSKMEVRDGLLISSEVQPHDKDGRLQFLVQYQNDHRRKIRGHASWFYGCSFAMPLELALEVNGFDEMCAITGYEDCNFGLRLEKAGCKFWYDARMKTIESIEHHSTDVVMKRIDPAVSQDEYYALMDKYGLSAQQPPTPARSGHPRQRGTYPAYERYDASHFEIDIVKFSQSYQSYVNGFDLRRLREKVAHGDIITVKDMNFPDKFWFTGEALSEM